MNPLEQLELLEPFDLAQGGLREAVERLEPAAIWNDLFQLERPKGAG